MTCVLGWSRVSRFVDVAALLPYLMQIVANVVSDSRLEAGLLGGGITLSSIEQVAKTAAIDQPDLYETITALVAGVGDLAKDPLTGACSQISATLSLTATTAYLFPGAATSAPAP